MSRGCQHAFSRHSAAGLWAGTRDLASFGPLSVARNGAVAPHHISHLTSHGTTSYHIAITTTTTRIICRFGKICGRKSCLATIWLFLTCFWFVSDLFAFIFISKPFAPRFSTVSNWKTRPHQCHHPRPHRLQVWTPLTPRNALGVPGAAAVQQSGDKSLVQLNFWLAPWFFIPKIRGMILHYLLV